MKTNFLIIWIPLILMGAANLECRGNDEISVLVDTDMGLDDVRALLAMFACEHVDIHGLVTVEGSSSLGTGTDHLIGLMESLGVKGIPVYQGVAAKGIEPPPWRDTANRLGGLTIPPPREIRSVPLKRMPDRSPRELHYLALGPLGNLARSPGMLERIHTLWIPVEIPAIYRSLPMRISNSFINAIIILPILSSSSMGMMIPISVWNCLIDT